MNKASFSQRTAALLVDWVLFWALGFALHSTLFGLAGILYETILVSQWNGRTVGKKVMGIRVLSTQGGPVKPTEAFIRALGKVLSSVVFLLGYFWMLWDAHSQTWHDKLADTFVVRD
jgi:uncharacterized RDD family membrane protein YckC